MLKGYLSRQEEIWTEGSSIKVADTKRVTKHIMTKTIAKYRPAMTFNISSGRMENRVDIYITTSPIKESA